MDNKVTIVALLALLALMLLGCTQGDNNTLNGDTNTLTSSNTGLNGTGSTTDVFGAFKSYMLMLPQYYAAYDYVVQSEETQNIVMQNWYKGNNVKVVTETQGTISSIFFIDGNAYMCTETNETVACYSITTGETQISYSDEIKKNIDSYEDKVVYDGTRTVLGQTTQCYKTTEEETESKFCYNQKGATLYMEGTSSESTWTAEATDYSETVSDSEFILPAEAQDLSDLFGDAFGADYNAEDYNWESDYNWEE
ncbi:MAG: hypothetical protein AABW59_04490 [archaeon]